MQAIDVSKLKRLLCYESQRHSIKVNVMRSHLYSLIMRKLFRIT